MVKLKFFLVILLEDSCVFTGVLSELVIPYKFRTKMCRRDLCHIQKALHTHTHRDLAGHRAKAARKSFSKAFACLSPYEKIRPGLFFCINFSFIHIAMGIPGHTKNNFFFHGYKNLNAFVVTRLLHICTQFRTLETDIAIPVTEKNVCKQFSLAKRDAMKKLEYVYNRQVSWQRSCRQGRTNLHGKIPLSPNAHLFYRHKEDA